MIPSVLNQIGERQTKRNGLRRELIQVSSEAQSISKRIIFAIHRGDTSGAKKLLTEARVLFKHGEVLCKREATLSHEGSWRAAQEEYAEASLFAACLEKRALTIPKDVSQDPEILLGGLSDMVGELARYGVLRVTEGDTKIVDTLYAIAADVVEFLLRLDLTGYLRTKFDQSKQHLRKLEDLRYDVSRRTDKL